MHYDPFEELTHIVGRAQRGFLREEFSIPMLPQHKLHKVLFPDTPYSDPLAAAIVMTELVRKSKELNRLLSDLHYCLDQMPYDWQPTRRGTGKTDHAPPESEVEPTLEES